MKINYLTKRLQTQWQGREITAIYNRGFYVEYNPDLKLQNLSDEECLEHFCTIGMRDGRSGSAQFDPKAYRYNYPELGERFGEDYAQYYMHYLESGMCNGWSGNYDMFRGKCFGKVFELHYYKRINPDIRAAYGDNHQEYIRHFVEYGMNEGRMANPYFDVFSYKRRYDIINNKSLDKLADYYYIYIDAADSCDITGDCSVYGDMDYALVYFYPYYRANNPDIREALGDNASLYIKHFVEHGMAEGRDGNGSFHVLRFRDEHPELQKQFKDYLPLYYIEYIKNCTAI